MVISYRCFGSNCWFHLQGFKQSKKMEPIRYPETCIRNYHSASSEMPEERISHLHHGRSLKSLTVLVRFVESNNRMTIE
jgi:hypothetical protein